MEEEIDGGGAMLSILLDSSEEDDKSLSSDIDGSTDEDPELCHDVILELAKYLNKDTIMSARLVNSAWNEGLETQFRSKLMLKVGFSFDRSIQDFISVFSPDATMPNGIWIQKPKFLKHKLMTKWLESYGDQLTTIKLAENTEFIKRLFPPEAVASILTKYCPNLKILEISAPFLYVTGSSLEKSINPDAKDVNVALDHLEIGHEDYDESPYKFTSTFLLSVLKCIKSLKSIKMNGVQKTYLHDKNGVPLEKRPGDDYAQRVFENIEELNLLCGNINPRRWINPASPEMEFHNLQKLQIGCFCLCQAGSPMEYLPGLLTSVKDHLKQLVFYPCPTDLQEQRFICPRLEKLFLSKMPKLEVFKIQEVMEWDDASLKFLEKLPALKELYISVDDLFEDEDISLPNVEEIFSVNKSRKRLIHEKMEQLTFMSYTKCSKNLDDIRLAFPNLKKLEVNFIGTPVFSIFWLFKKLKDLKIHLCETFDSLDSHDFEGISGSAVEKLWLTQNYVEFKPRIKLSSIVDGCLSSSSLRQLKLEGMKVSRKEYKFSMGLLNMAKLKMWLINCEIYDKVA